jgi:hypothetical protein
MLNLNRLDNADFVGDIFGVGLPTSKDLSACNYAPALRRNILFPSSGLEVVTTCFPKTFVSACKSASRYNPYNQHRLHHRRENLKSNKSILKYGKTIRKMTIKSEQP